MLRCVVLLAVCFVQAFTRPDSFSFFEDDIHDDRYMHSHVVRKRDTSAVLKKYNLEEETADYWRNQAQFTLNELLTKKPIKGVARNVILFLGDGMSIPTLAAARAYLGQKNNKPGEETQLSFERFPFTGLSKTYCVDRQVADSACSATAYLCGVKANEGTIGVTATVPLGDCKPMQNTTNYVYSIARWSQLRGKRTGVVTTTRITHASPAGVYAHTAHRDWESDSDVLKAESDPKICTDIAVQLLEGDTGKNLNVILGGGRGKFVPINETDDEGEAGLRSDQRNLINEWKKQKEGSTHEYVWNRTELLEVPSNTEYLLGLFAKDHTDYNLDRNPEKKPSLTEMTTTAIKLLSQGSKGYFLFVEGGRIDHAHHDTQARKALDETVEFHKAIQAAVDMTNAEDTLIVVTSDHAHTMSVSGYASRGNDIFGSAGTADDKLPYSTLSYANGPGYRKEEDGKRHNFAKDDTSDKEYKYPALAPLVAETHGGDDVGIFAHGPWAHLLVGVLEQNVIPHVMAYASCVGDGITVCDEIRKK